MVSEYTTREQQRDFYKSNAWRGNNGLREQALRRDGYECVMCREEGKVTTRDHATLEVDHIFEIEIHPEKAHDLDSLRTLCRYHHNKRHNRFGFVKKEKKWNNERW
ncbi:hypothetical protein SRABI96_03375 [Peribacillus sp. Bi96]|uniref:HNH endonuclease signature motif containing protein n=1 Tax=unclassified Peribacillus TaxID=2675266 RepID=UPI001D829604|nr:HNH endonuclease signature motif containing protein [Peribacillus sp. Bi96]CAH0259107.1 hypothetical protein SRABI96_03375 [Peribacillus sp. Bi96]